MEKILENRIETLSNSLPLPESQPVTQPVCLSATYFHQNWSKFLEAIIIKSNLLIPPRLQTILIKLMTYDAETKFIAEKFHHFSGALSWAHSPLNLEATDSDEKAASMMHTLHSNLRDTAGKLKKK